jgi:hypothetical protein
MFSPLKVNGGRYHDEGVSSDDCLEEDRDSIVRPTKEATTTLHNS